MTRTAGLMAAVALLWTAGSAAAQIELLHVNGTALGDGLWPEGELFVSSAKVCGTTPDGLGNEGVVYCMDLDGGNYEVIKEFAAADGATPLGGLCAFGILFGTTSEGGPNGGGTVFSVSASGSGYTRLHAFTDGSPDGFRPQSQLLISLPDIYGTTLCGGVGTLFRLVDGEAHEVLHAFEWDDPPVDGWQPMGRPLLHDGRLYGVTRLGGLHYFGTIYRIELDGGGYEQLLHFYGGDPRGCVPAAGLIVVDGWLCGVMSSGGTDDHGTVFRLRPDGTDYQVLHRFVGTDGSRPDRRLTEADGVLYGVTPEGGKAGKGVLFGLRPHGGGFKVLHHFGTSGHILEHPSSALVHRDGKLYGAAREGTFLDYGGVYRFDPGTAMNPVATGARFLLLGP